MDVMLAPCGIDCGICEGHLRSKNRCDGCLSANNQIKSTHIKTCSKIKCTLEHNVVYCFECDRFPCLNIRKLEKRYAIKYGESPIENGLFVKNNGIDAFIKLENEKWHCKNCHAVLSVHKPLCRECQNINPHFPIR